MMATIILVVIATCLLLALLGIARGRSAAIHDLEEVEKLATPVDVLAFRNLTDPREESYLRIHLSRGDFRALQRERMRVAVLYVRCAARNAAILVRLGEAARTQSDERVAEAGRQLAESAIQLRLYAFIALAMLYARILLPGAVNLTPVRLADRYERLTEIVGSFARLQRPALAGRVSSAL